MSFSFKQFTIQQDRTAMKVCTDACLFGAWVASCIEKKNNEDLKILDIGAGTGLLSLMLAQKAEAIIDAIEIDSDAAIQAKDNILNSKWPNKIRVHLTSIQEFTPDHKYDVIISNPPFYENDLVSPDKMKNTAKHQGNLDFRTLVSIYSNSMKKHGKGFILIPYHRLAKLKEIIAEKDLYIHQLVCVRQSVNHGYFRAMIEIRKEEGRINEIEISIHDNYRKYTDEFTQLLKGYYLKL